jgi:hypothetical protein
MITHKAKRSFEKMKNIFFVCLIAAHNKKKSQSFQSLFLKSSDCIGEVRFRQVVTSAKQKFMSRKLNVNDWLQKRTSWLQSITTCKEKVRSWMQNVLACRQLRWSCKQPLRICLHDLIDRRQHHTFCKQKLPTCFQDVTSWLPSLRFCLPSLNSFKRNVTFWKGSLRSSLKEVTDCKEDARDWKEEVNLWSGCQRADIYDTTPTNRGVLKTVTPRGSKLQNTLGERHFSETKIKSQNFMESAFITHL